MKITQLDRLNFRFYGTPNEWREIERWVNDVFDECIPDAMWLYGYVDFLISFDELDGDRAMLFKLAWV